jgi:hypothetical protein
MSDSLPQPSRRELSSLTGTDELFARQNAEMVKAQADARLANHHEKDTELGGIARLVNWGLKKVWHAKEDDTGATLQSVAQEIDQHVQAGDYNWVDKARTEAVEKVVDEDRQATDGSVRTAVAEGVAAAAYIPIFIETKGRIGKVAGRIGASALTAEATTLSTAVNTLTTAATTWFRNPVALGAGALSAVDAVNDNNTTSGNVFNVIGGFAKGVVTQEALSAIWQAKALTTAVKAVASTQVQILGTALDAQTYRGANDNVDLASIGNGFRTVATSVFNPVSVVTNTALAIVQPRLPAKLLRTPIIQKAVSAAWMSVWSEGIHQYQTGELDFQTGHADWTKLAAKTVGQTFAGAVGARLSPHVLEQVEPPTGSTPPPEPPDVQPPGAKTATGPAGADATKPADAGGGAPGGPKGPSDVEPPKDADAKPPGSSIHADGLKSLWTKATGYIDVTAPAGHAPTAAERLAARAAFLTAAMAHPHEPEFLDWVNGKTTPNPADQNLIKTATELVRGFAPAVDELAKKDAKPQLRSIIVAKLAALGKDDPAVLDAAAKYGEKTIGGATMSGPAAELVASARLANQGNAYLDTLLSDSSDAAAKARAEADLKTLVTGGAKDIRRSLEQHLSNPSLARAHVDAARGVINGVYDGLEIKGLRLISAVYDRNRPHPHPLSIAAYRELDEFWQKHGGDAFAGPFDEARSKFYKPEELQVLNHLSSKTNGALGTPEFDDYSKVAQANLAAAITAASSAPSAPGRDAAVDFYSARFRDALMVKRLSILPGSLTEQLAMYDLALREGRIHNLDQNAPVWRTVEAAYYPSTVLTRPRVPEANRYDWDKFERQLLSPRVLDPDSSLPKNNESRVAALAQTIGQNPVLHSPIREFERSLPSGPVKDFLQTALVKQAVFDLASTGPNPSTRNEAIQRLSQLKQRNPGVLTTISDYAVMHGNAADMAQFVDGAVRVCKAEGLINKVVSAGDDAARQAAQSAFNDFVVAADGSGTGLRTALEHLVDNNSRFEDTQSRDQARAAVNAAYSRLEAEGTILLAEAASRSDDFESYSKLFNFWKLHGVDITDKFSGTGERASGMLAHLRAMKTGVVELSPALADDPAFDAARFDLPIAAVSVASLPKSAWVNDPRMRELISHLMSAKPETRAEFRLAIYDAAIRNPALREVVEVAVAQAMPEVPHVTGPAAEAWNKFTATLLDPQALLFKDDDLTSYVDNLKKLAVADPEIRRNGLELESKLPPGPLRDNLQEALAMSALETDEAGMNGAEATGGGTQIEANLGEAVNDLESAREQVAVANAALEAAIDQIRQEVQSKKTELAGLGPIDATFDQAAYDTAVGKLNGALEAQVLYPKRFNSIGQRVKELEEQIAGMEAARNKRSLIDRIAELESELIRATNRPDQPSRIQEIEVVRQSLLRAQENVSRLESTIEGPERPQADNDAPEEIGANRQEPTAEQPELAELRTQIAECEREADEIGRQLPSANAQLAQAQAQVGIAEQALRVESALRSLRRGITPVDYEFYGGSSLDKLQRELDAAKAAGNAHEVTGKEAEIARFKRIDRELGQIISNNQKLGDLERRFRRTTNNPDQPASGMNVDAWRQVLSAAPQKLSELQRIARELEERATVNTEKWIKALAGLEKAQNGEAAAADGSAVPTGVPSGSPGNGA